MRFRLGHWEINLVGEFHQWGIVATLLNISAREERRQREKYEKEQRERARIYAERNGFGFPRPAFWAHPMANIGEDGPVKCVHYEDFQLLRQALEKLGAMTDKSDSVARIAQDALKGIK